jgi:acyl carrier protein
MDYQAVYDQTKQILMEYLRVNAEEIMPETNLIDDLMVDSIAMVELGFRFSEAFSIPMPQPTEDLYIMGNLVQFLTNQINQK